MRKIILFTFLLGFYLTSTAQYTDLINSRRPGFSDSPFGVGIDVLQVESGLFYRDQKEVRSHLKSIGTDVMFRYGKFFEKLEMNLNLSFQSDKVTYTNQSYRTDTDKIGLTQLTIGAKYLLYMPKYKDKNKEIRSWKKKNRFDLMRLIPSVAIYAGANIPITNSYVGGNFDRFIKGEFSPRIAIYMQNNFTKRFIFVSNLIMDKLGTDYKENSYILTSTYSINERWSIFAEHQGIFKKNTPDDFQFGGGVAYLLSPDMQVDFSARAIDDRDGSTFFAGAGFSWRLDRHKDKIVSRDDEGNVIKEEKEGTFFSRLFKKKNKKKRRVKKIKAKKRKVKKLDSKKTKKQKREDKEAKRKSKEDRKKRKKELKSYKKNYKAPTEENQKENDNNDKGN